MTGNTNALPPRTTLSHRLLTLILLTSLLAINTLAFAEPPTRQYNIPAGSLAHALNNLAEHSDLQVIYDTGLTQGLSTKGFKGSYSTAAALQKLLAGTGLVYTLSNGEVTIRAVDKTPKAFVPVANPPKTENLPPASDTTLEKVVVEADSSNPYDDPTWATDPKNTDYNRPNATTATKTDTPIMETPVNVQVVPQQVLKDQQIIRLDKALENVSGVIARPAADTGIGGGDSFMLRGFDSFPASVYRDGMRLVFSGQTDLAAIERVEVLKGPAAILYGRIEPGGLINQVGKQPLANPFYALQQQFGSFDFYRTTLDATGPINSEKSLKYRFNLAFETADSFQEFINNERVVAAPVLRWDISPATQVTLELNYRHSMDPLSPGIPFIGNRPAPVPRERNFGESTHTLRGTDDIYAGINWSHAFNENWSFNHRFYIDRTNRFQQANVFLNSGVLNTGDLIERSGEEPEGDSGSTDYYTTYNLAGHFNTGLFQHTVLLGGDYYQNQNDPGKGVGFAIPPIDVFQPVHDANRTIQYTYDDSGESQDWYGFYLQDQVELPFDVHVLAGFRYDHASTSTDITVTDFSAGLGQTSKIQEQREDEAVTPRFGLVWRPLPELSLYGNYVENFGANNGSDENRKPLPPQTAQQWELGVKTELFNGRLTGSLAWFDLTKQNVPRPNPENPLLSIATGEVRHQGLELDLAGEFLPNWRTVATYTYLDSEVTKDSAQEFDEQGNVIGMNAGSTGNRIAGTPRHMASLWTTYEIGEGLLSGLKFGAGVVARSQNFADQANNDLRIPGYAIVNALASYEWMVGKSKLTAQLNVDNLFDKTYFANTGSGITAFYGTPRTFMGSMRVEF